MKINLHWIFLPLVFLFSACGQPATLPAPATVRQLPTPVPTARSTSTPVPTATSTPEPTWYTQIDASYSNLKYRYGLVSNPSARVYVTLEDAATGSGNFGLLGEVPIYIYINGEQILDGKTWYSTRLGWISANEVALVTPSSLRGILPIRPIEFKFGWVLKDIQSTNAAGAAIRAYTRYEIVHEVAAVTSNPGYFSVGPDEWLPLDALALTDALRPEEMGPEPCRFIHVNLSSQTLRVFDACHLVFATLISTGRDPRWTSPGQYTILSKIEYTKLTPPEGSISVYSLEGVPNFISYAGDWGFHAAYWHDDFGTPVSHGCVNLSPADASWLYNWAHEGELVFIIRP